MAGSRAVALDARGGAGPCSASMTDWPLDIHAALKRAGVTLVSYVPDAGHKRLIELCRADPGMEAVVLTTEEEGVGFASGAWLGGKRAALLMQSSGIGNCPNALAMARTCGFPFLTLVTMRGEWGEFNPWQLPMGQTGPEALRLAGCAVHRIDAAEEAGATVEAAAKLAFDARVSVAVLIAQRLIGTKSFQK
jgi:sulfopyruvate decarboxylase alpha subunit